MTRHTWSHTTACLTVLVGLLIGPPADAREKPQSTGNYVRVDLTTEGAAPGSELDGMAGKVRAELGRRRDPIVVMVHGFAQKDWTATANYEISAERMKAEAREMGYSPVLVGVHWDSDVGSMSQWMARVTGARVAALVGLKKAVKNPYLEKTGLSREVGRNGLRNVLFRLQDEFPETPIHCVAHSLGAEVVVTALAPTRENADFRPISQPDRMLRLNMVAFVGGDLDCDAFVRKNAETRAALDRVGIWWLTVPKSGAADAVLELRRGAGKPDAIGNSGMKLEPEDLEKLLQRRGLVIDQRDIPTAHSMVKYMNRERAGALAASVLYLQASQAPAAQSSVLARVDAMLAGKGAPASGENAATIALYAAWKSQPQKVAGFRFVQTTEAAEANERRDRPSPLLAKPAGSSSQPALSGL